MSTTTNSNVLQNSVVLIGPAGVGKSVVARALGEAKNMPVVTLDILRHCPTSLAEIEKRKLELAARCSSLKKEIGAEGSDRLRDEFIKELRELVNEIWVCDEQLRLRKMFPTVPNYEEMGFNGDVSHWLEDNYNKIAWHFYQKQFENALLASVMQAATEPCIFDLGGGMAISLDPQYKVLAEQFKKLDAKHGTNLFEKNFNMSKVGFDKIEKTLGQFSHVVSLELPRDYIYRDTRAGHDELNPLFTTTGQYNMLASDPQHIINVDNLVLHRGGINKEKLAEIVDAITTLSTSKKLRK